MMSLEAILTELRAVATAYPEAYEETPWGELAVKVNKKVFAFYGLRDGRLALTVKLPASRELALQSPGCSPTGYGLGRHGWVSAGFTDPAEVDLPTLLGWLEESYRAVAPKRLAKRVPEGGPRPEEAGPLPAVPDGAPEVVVVSDDRLRAERAIRGLAERGLRGLPASTADLDAIADTAAALIVVDLGRSASIALAIAGQLSMLHFDCPLVLSGIRDARAEAAAREALPAATAWLRAPPGDEAVLEAIQTALS